MSVNPYLDESFDESIANNIDTYGWHVNKIVEDEFGPSYAYSIGFYQSFGHPEIIIIGPNVDVAHFVINIIGEAITKGTKFIPDSFYPSLIKDAFLYFTPVAQKYYDNYVDHAQHYYKDPGFPLLQCVYPAPNGAYPGQDEWPKQFSNTQPYLGKSPIKELHNQPTYSESTIKLPLPLFD